MKKTRKNIIKNPVSKSCRKITDDEVCYDNAELYRIITGNSIDGFAAIYPDGHFIDINKAFCRMTGYNKDELLSMFIQDMEAADIPEAANDRIKNLIKAGSGLFDLKLRRKDRRSIDLEVSASYSAKSDLLLLFLRDITARRLNDDALRKANDTLNAILDSLPVAVFDMDADGIIQSIWNPAAEYLLGWTRKEALGHFLPSVQTDAARNEFKKLREAVESGQSVIGVDLSRHGKDGTPIQYSLYAAPIRDLKGHITGNIAMLVDTTERKRYEEALASSESFLNSIINQSPHPMWISDDKGTMIRINKACVDLLHISEQDVIGKYNIFKDKIIEQHGYLPLIRQVFEAGQTVNFEFKYESGKDKKIKLQEAGFLIIDVTIFPIRDASGKITNAVIQHIDVTEAKRSENALRESEKRYRQLLDSVSDYIYTIRIEDGRPASTQHGPGCIAVTGYTPEEYKADSYLWYNMIYEEDRQIVSEQIVKMFSGNKAESIEHRVIHKNGTLRWVRNTPVARCDPDGTLTGYDGIIMDITDRKEVEAALQSAKEYAENLIQTANTMVVGLDLKGSITVFNQAAQEITGYSRTDLENRNWFEIVVPRDRYPEVWKEFERLNKGGMPLRFENPILTKSGEERYIVWQNNLVREKDRVIGIISFGMDITERKNTEEERERLYSQLRQAQKMEALGTFVGGIAHDFNNLLSIIIGYATLLQMEIDSEDQKRSYVDLILSSSEKAANLTQGLLAFSRKQAMNLKPIRLNELIKGTEKLLIRLLTEDISLKKKYTKENTVIMGDESQIDQILFNLATNARDAMPKGGKLAIETSIVELDDEFIRMIGYGKPGKFVLMSISDTGIGIDTETKEHIFDPFFTTKEVGKGTGLGLSTVYGIVKQHSGYINVYSEPNVGTTFHIYFPSAGVYAREKQKASQKIRQGKETILIAEDNEGVRSLMKKILVQYGYKIIEAVDGEDAMEKFSRNKKVDFMIIDSVMPKKNGREVYNEIIKINPDVKVLFTSGYTRDVVLDKGIEEKEFDFISKPITPKKLLHKVSEILERK
ncbi:MAG: PAS domain S-box protein [Spirochaetes bacterium]|nr:PAS domain S-box protein [Spirochaetota bacterium]